MPYIVIKNVSRFAIMCLDDDKKLKKIYSLKFLSDLNNEMWCRGLQVKPSERHITVFGPTCPNMVWGGGGADVQSPRRIRFQLYDYLYWRKVFSLNRYLLHLESRPTLATLVQIKLSSPVILVFREQLHHNIKIFAYDVVITNNLLKSLHSVLTGVCDRCAFRIAYMPVIK